MFGKAEISYSLEKVDVGEFLHLVHISLGFDHFLVVEQDPGLASTFVSRDRFADECYVMSGNN